MSVLNIVDNCVDYGHLARVRISTTFLNSVVKIGIGCANGVLIVCWKELHTWLNVSEL